MSSFAPPTYVVSIYNPTYFTTSGTGLTLAQASAQFLNKNSADTASALETFTGGIATNSVATTSTSSNFTLGSSTNTGTITIATINTGNSNASPAISIGADAGAKTIKINNNSNSVHCSSIDLAGSSINNIAGATGAISIGDLQTDAGATISIGGNAARGGNISIGQTTTAFTTTIGSNNASAVVNLRNPVSNYTYTSLPNYSSGGSTIYYVLNTLGGTTTTLGAESTAISTGGDIGIGIYYVSYSLRLSALSTSASASVTAFKTFISVTNQTSSAATPVYYGESSQLYSQTAPIFTTLAGGLFPTINGSAIIKVATAGTVSVKYFINAAAAVVWWNDGITVRPPYNYLCVTRIA